MIKDEVTNYFNLYDEYYSKISESLKYGEEEVATWDDNKIMEMTVGTNVFLAGNVKILNAMEDFDFEITM